MQVDDTHSTMAKVQDRSKRKRAFMTRAVKSSPFSTGADPAEEEANLAAPQADQEVHHRTRGPSSGRRDHWAARGTLNHPPLPSTNKHSRKKIITT